jgi:mannose-1-phosphate guanylyltransferase
MPVLPKLMEGFHSMQAMLLAAGLGTRLRPYSHIRPKPLFPVLNRPLLLILLDMLQQAGCTRIVVNGHHLSHLVEETVSRLPNVLFQAEPEILGTGGSLRQALPLFSGEPLLVMNGDICHDIDIATLYRHHRQAGNAVTMALHDYPRFNTVAIRDGAVFSFRPDNPVVKENLLAFTGIHVVDPEIIRRIPGGRFFHIIDLYEELIREGGKISFSRVDGSFWCDIGTLEDYLQLHADLLTGSRRHSLPLEKPASQWLVSRDAVIGDNVDFAGWGCVGKAKIGADVSLRNCVVWDGATIPAESCLEDAIVTRGRR